VNTVNGNSISTSSQVVLSYISTDCVILNLPFIYTTDKKLFIGMPYMKLEGKHTDAIRLLKVWDKNNIVYLKIEDLKTHIINVISHNMEYTGDFWLWSLADFAFIMNLVE